MVRRDSRDLKDSLGHVVLMDSRDHWENRDCRASLETKVT